MYKVGMYGGCFDPLHIGHINVIAHGAALCEELQNADVLKLGAGCCTVCKTCAYPDAPCRFPEKMHPCVESHGINILPIIEELGLTFQYGENVVTWFSLLLY